MRAARRVRMRSQDGQVFPIMALFMIVIAAILVLTIDVGRVYVAQQQLQNAVNAAALAAGQQMPNDAQAVTAADKYGGTGTAGNAPFGYDVSTGAPTVTFECLSHGTDYVPPATQGGSATCPSDTSPGATTATDCNPAGSTPASPSVGSCNAVYIKETATVKSIFGGLIFPSWTVSASAIAAAHASGTKPLDVFTIIDTTGSMEDQCEEAVGGTPAISASADPDKEECAKGGVQSLLEALIPCLSTTTSCGTDPTPSLSGANWATPIDEAGMMVVPGNTAQFASYEDDCNTTNTPNYKYEGVSYGDDGETSGTDNQQGDDEYPPWVEPTGGTLSAIPSSDSGSAAAGYEAVGLSSDYRTSGSTTSTALNPSSDLVKSVSTYACSTTAWPGSYSTTINRQTTTVNGDFYGIKEIDGHGSYLAGAVTYAEYALLTASRASTTTPVIVIESDGDLDTPSNNSVNWAPPTSSSSAAAYEAFEDPCLSAIEAADQAKAAGVAVYSIQFDAANEPCADDSTDTRSGVTSGPAAETDAAAAHGIAHASVANGGIAGFPAPTTTVSPSTADTYGDIQTMQDMAGPAYSDAGATGTPYYYNDPNTSGSTNPLAADFSAVGQNLANARLIPACSQLPPNC
jgi:Flp pilus assembly protein TadG